jgi:hypothetical protein
LNPRLREDPIQCRSVSGLWLNAEPDNFAYVVLSRLEFEGIEVIQELILVNHREDWVTWSSLVFYRAL